MARNRTLGYTNYKSRGTERPISITKNMGDHNNSKHHLNINNSLFIFNNYFDLAFTNIN